MTFSLSTMLNRVLDNQVIDYKDYKTGQWHKGIICSVTHRNVIFYDKDNNRISRPFDKVYLTTTKPIVLNPNELPQP